VTDSVLAVDGGNSKTDIALVGPDGGLLAAVRGPTTSHQAVGLEAGIARLVGLVEDAARQAGLDAAARPISTIGVHAIAGADFTADVRMLERALAGARLSARDVVVNDCIGALWGGASEGWGIALICGQGINGAAIAPDGRTARFDGVGDISGDWGGGTSVGMSGLAAAVRARDGRGPRTSLERLVPAHFGLGRPSAVTRAFYDDRIADARVGELSPVVFAAAGQGDPVARSIVDRLADELVTMAVALARRTAMTRRPVEVVLAGGVFSTTDEPFFARIEAGIQAVVRDARLVRLDVPPVTGAGLHGLDLVGTAGPARDAARQRLRTELKAWSRAVGSGR
jgi:N-acetylglucosamine kinase-like BadF-type ATPase